MSDPTPVAEAWRVVDGRVTISVFRTREDAEQDLREWRMNGKDAYYVEPLRARTAPVHFADKRHRRAVVCGLPLFAHDTGDPAEVTCDVCREILTGSIVLVTGRQATACVLTPAEIVAVLGLVALGERHREHCCCHVECSDETPNPSGHCLARTMPTALAACAALTARLHAAVKVKAPHA